MGEDNVSCNYDRISTLPVEVKDVILTFLPLREAVRTSILSTSWRYNWINLSKLIINDTTCQFSRDGELLARYKLISTINHILLLHDGPIFEFSLSHSTLGSCLEIDHFTIFLSMKSVHEFSLGILKGKEHKLHSSFFTFQELTHLNLSNCLLTPPPAFKGFPRLVNLKLVNVVFSMDIFLNFVSSCHQLESLTLINPPKFNSLILSSLSLKYLNFEGSCEFFRFGDVPLLQSASLTIKDLSTSLKDEETREIIEFFYRLPSLKKLVTNYLLLLHLAVGGVPKKLPTSISLVTLKLSDISFAALGDVSSIYCLISSCPSIKRIEIEIYNSPEDVKVDQVLDFLKTQDLTSDVTVDELREVHLTGVSGVEPELEFIKLLLAKSPALKTMLIKTKKKDDCSRLELLTKLTRFQRASSMAEIIYE